MKSLLLNLSIALIWLLLSQETSAVTFVIGFLIGFAFVAAFRAVLGSEHYVRNSVAFVRFVLIFMREFLVANVKVAGTVLARPRTALHPNFITYDVAGLTPFEILLLSYCISLTPGTTTVQVADDFQTLIVHALDADAPDAIRADIDRTLKRGILSFTR
jgi:multisubunit Na+/H+ antiporter MnhE subunit